ncbi:uncharacterized protein BDZ99DRAFT_515473 [Mytilinidion resinicola]|uniref:Uncharacterized protein n=1 Tax=Mytilinidion resinicola TaxID=574789 RepID=A0A6A6Z3F7_9PEZI|nr:uncharacterized protein BDZ99DRAFT_515473 [Mytilinidion resinicola]KAF2814695.1 hypothetical protein BDZ99DRAFT_515473 [Mytilinidion resinicola]
MSALHRKSFFKRRSAHGLFSSPQLPTASSPHAIIAMAGMLGDHGDRRPVSPSTIASGTEDQIEHAIDGGAVGAVGEPLVQDFQELYHGPNVSAPRTPVNTPVSRPSPLGSHPVVSSDEETAPAPPDFTSRGIHIPTRTRCIFLPFPSFSSTNKSIRLQQQNKD